jgi:hypothetical protein
MRKVIVSEFITVDGVIQSPGYADEDRSEGFDLGGWQPPYFEDTFGRVMMEGLTTNRRVPARAPNLRDLRGVLAERSG